MPKPMDGHSRYMGGIDGLRAVAVFAVILYHLNVNFAPGGLLGVGIFFVLSGYLITDILVSQWHREGQISLRDFWVRRARRLLPALLVMLGVIATFMSIFVPTQLAPIRGDFFAALLYVSNWWYIFHHVSYFASFGPPSPLGHLWSLAVEEQFYLLWPFLLLIGLRTVRSKRWLTVITLLLAALSALAMGWLYHPGLDPTRVYDGTDTRAFALLIGAALAFLWPSRQLSLSLSAKSRIILDLLGGLGFLSLLFMIWKTNEYQSFLYQGGLVLVSIATAVTIAALAHPASRFAKILGWAPLRWLGVRSYAIYLWHYPVIVLTSPTVNTTGVDVLRAILQVAASVALATLSWLLVEDPIRRGALGRLFSHRSRGKHVAKGKNRFRVFAATGALLISCGCGVGTVESTSAATTPLTNPQPTQKPVTPATSITHLVHTAVAKPKLNSNPYPNTKSSLTPGKKADLPPATTQPASSVLAKSGHGISVIGDSVMVDAGPDLGKLLPGIVVSAQVGRQWYQLPASIAELKSEKELGQRVIIETGTNGPFTSDQLKTILHSLSGVQQIFLVNTRVPRPWQDIVNSTLAQVVASFPNATLVDWYTASAGKNNYFYQDGVHLNATGAEAYAQLLVNALKEKQTN